MLRVWQRTLTSLAGVAMASTVAAMVGTPQAVADASSTISGFAPAYAPVGATVHITGTVLTNATDVLFGTVDAGAPTVLDDSTLAVAVPAGATTAAVTVKFADATEVTSAGNFVVQQPTTATIAHSTAVVTYPSAAHVIGTLFSNGVKVYGQTATIQQRPVGTTTWHSMSPVRTTTTSGVAAWWVRPSAATDYRIVFAASPSYAGRTTSATRIHVRPHLKLWAATAEPILTTFRITGAARPVPVNPVRLERYYSGAWHFVARAAVGSNAYYSFHIKLPYKGTFTYRTHYLGDTTHWSSVSPTVHILGVNRTLHTGLSGPDVLALQKRLAALHYDIGAVNGYFGFDTQHAVVAFEKVNSLKRDGIVGTTVWSRLAKPVVPTLRHPYANVSAVEVDLTHQVVLYAVNGHVSRILDSSTGGGYYYYGSDGSLQRAITPTGHFAIVYKVDHWVTSKLGTLYRPAYFNNSGYAIHGEGDVPSYPASHGCVRITVPAMDRMYSKLYDGMSVWIY